MKSYRLYISLLTLLFLIGMTGTVFADQTGDSLKTSDIVGEVADSLSTVEVKDSVDLGLFKTSLNAYPYAYYSPEVQFAFGAGGVVSFYLQKSESVNPSDVTFSGWYSTSKSYEVSLVANLYAMENRRAALVDIRLSHKLDKFYGIGNNTPDLGTEEFFIDRTGGLFGLETPPLVVNSDRSGIAYEYRKIDIVDKKDNPYLDSDSLIGANGGIISGLGGSWTWDNRDHRFFPNKGGLTETAVLFYTKTIGSDFTYTWIEINARRYWAFSEDHVLAAQLYVNSVAGTPPYFSLPALGGGNVMRGYFQGRYRDNHLVAAQFEYRQYFWRRLGFVAFAGAGDVAPEITSFYISDIKPTYGLGLRVLFNKKRKINLRVDLGIGRGTTGIYFGMKEAF